MPAQYNVVGFESLTVSNSAVGLTLPTGAKSFVGKLETADIRARGDGTAPTASVGVLIETGEVMVLADSEVNRSRFIRVGGSDGTLQGHYYSVEASALFGAAF
jgi:hypothetical protein